MLRWEPLVTQLAEEASNAAVRWTERRGLRTVVQVAGEPAWSGEASPLPGYSSETLEHCEESLRQLTRAQLDQLVAAPDAVTLGGLLRSFAPRAPSVRFALEVALLVRLATREQLPLWQLLARDFERAELLGPSAGVATEQANPSLDLCAWLTTTEASALQRQAASAHARGARSFKLKIGPGRVSVAQWRAMAELRERYGWEIRVRVDANRTLSPDHWQRELEALAEWKVEFCEEPTRELTPAACAESPCPLALDESLHGGSRQDLLALLRTGRVSALVLKPTCLGGLLSTWQWARDGLEHGATPVVSHTLEGPLAYAACLHLAFALSAQAKQAMPAAGLWPLPHQWPVSCAALRATVRAPRQVGLSWPA